MDKGPKAGLYHGCIQIVFVAEEGSELSEISCEYRSGSHDESWSNSPKSASFLISFSRGYTGPSLDNALCQFLAALMYSKCSRILLAQRLSLLSPYAFSSTFFLYLMTFSIKVKEEMFFQKTEEAKFQAIGPQTMIEVPCLQVTCSVSYHLQSAMQMGKLIFF